MSVLLREAIGGTIRRARTERNRTLRDVSHAARVSLGYLSEVERGRKEPSSELLAAICEALALPLPDLLDDVADALRPTPLRPTPVRRRDVAAVPRVAVLDPALRHAVEEALEPVADGEAAELDHDGGTDTTAPAGDEPDQLGEGPEAALGGPVLPPAVDEPDDAEETDSTDGADEGDDTEVVDDPVVLVGLVPLTAVRPQVVRVAA